MSTSTISQLAISMGKMSLNSSGLVSAPRVPHMLSQNLPYYSPSVRAGSMLAIRQTQTGSERGKESLSKLPTSYVPQVIPPTPSAIPDISLPSSTSSRFVVTKGSGLLLGRKTLPSVESDPFKTSALLCPNPKSGRSNHQVSRSTNPARQESVAVTVRLRPLTSDHEASLTRPGVTHMWRANPRTGTITAEPKASPSDSSQGGMFAAAASTLKKRKQAPKFAFDHVFEGSDNEAIYKQAVQPMVKACLQGYHGTVFAYGQTSSGKTYTMTGTPESPGVTPQAVYDIFSMMDCAIYDDRKFQVYVSYMEIYNEAVYDLAGSKLTDGSPGLELQVREDANGGTVIVGLAEERVESFEEAYAVLERGNANRRIAETDWNDRSSRSHSIFRIRVTSDSAGDQGDSGERYKLSAQLALIDLAGSEKASLNSDRRKEGSHINRSLLTLGTVISRLAANTSRTQSPSDSPTSRGHIPYRDSKLTRALQPLLSGRGYISVICTISGEATNNEETLNTLKFAARAKQVKIQPVVEKVVNEQVELERLQRENEELKRRVMELESRGGPEAWHEAIAAAHDSRSISPPADSPTSMPSSASRKLSTEESRSSKCSWKDMVIQHVVNGDLAAAKELAATGARVHGWSSRSRSQHLAMGRFHGSLKAQLLRLQDMLTAEALRRGNQGDLGDIEPDCKVSEGMSRTNATDVTGVRGF